MYVKALSTVFAKCTGFDNIDLFILRSLSGRTYKADLCAERIIGVPVRVGSILYLEGLINFAIRCFFL